MNLWLANPNYRFGANAFLPYAAARLWAYASAQPDVYPHWRLAGTVWEREPLADVLKRMCMAPPDVLGLSLYIWSERYCLALALEVARAFPDCVVVAGGPQVPERGTKAWLGAHPEVDVAVLGEGERALADVLRCAARGDPLVGRDTVYDADRVVDLAELRSPYLDGVLDGLVRSRPDVQWQALQETNRGCPYACRFCDWGSATYDKVRRFPLAVCVEELEWFARNRIELLYNCDANFGMLEQDVAFTDALLRVAQRTGYPQKFRAAYAKKINERVFSVSKRIADAGLSKGATISFQSMNEEVLRNVARLNPVQGSLKETFARYNTANIPTYTELIVGLPGETLESFKDGVDALLEAGQHDGLAVYPCMALRNSELSRPECRAQHGIKTREVDLLLLHGVPDAEDPAPERYELVVETATMSHADWRAAWEFGIVVQAVHCSGLMQGAARLSRRFGERYRHFYEKLIAVSRANPAGAIGKALRWWNGVLDDALAGKPWATALPGFGPVQWPPEEAVRLLVTREWCPELTDDWEAWAREQVWYGRKGGVKREEREAA